MMAEVSGGNFLLGFLPLFYLKSSSNSSFKEVSEVPDYVQQVTFQFFTLIVIEAVLRWLQGKSLPRMNDSINSMTAGIMMEITRALTGAFDITSYIWVHHNFCMVKLPWDSPVTWWLAFLMVDFVYYWFHRMAHEINLFWAAHQVHHSSEDYTLSTALRQSILQRFSSWFFYLPFAVFVPPPAYMVHKQLNLLYQFWIHTEVVSTIGPLEWILNTPSHHRVHHGRNPYCIDKNYGGVLIIWDRMFGTFVPESEKVVYGLVHPLNTWNPLWAQFQHLIYIITSIGSQTGWKNKIAFLLKGPGWSPGKPRLGNIKDIPEVSPDEKPYDTHIPWWLNTYCMVHFAMVLILSHELGKEKNTLSYFTLVVAATFIFFSLTNFGLMCERRTSSIPLEILRLAIFAAAEFMLGSATGMSWMTVLLFRALIGFSIALWTAIAAKHFTLTFKTFDM